MFNIDQSTINTILIVLGVGLIIYQIWKKGREKINDSSEAFTIYQSMVSELKDDIKSQKEKVSALEKIEYECRIERLKTQAELSIVTKQINQLQKELDIYKGDRAILEGITDAIVAINQNGSIVSWNQGATNIFGWLPEEIVGRNVTWIMPKPECDEHNSYINNYLRTGKTSIIGKGRVVKAVHKQGGLIDVELSVGEAKIMGTADRIFTGIFRKVNNEKKLPAIQQ